MTATLGQLKKAIEACDAKSCDGAIEMATAQAKDSGEDTTVWRIIDLDDGYAVGDAPDVFCRPICVVKPDGTILN